MGLSNSIAYINMNFYMEGEEPITNQPVEEVSAEETVETPAEATPEISATPEE